METVKLWLRWSWRDLRARWLQVAAIALIIALGTGAYAGMGTSAPWRQQAYDASYALLNMYDLRVRLGESYVDANSLLNAIRNIQHKDSIRNAEARLIASTLVDASTGDQTILVPGRIVGVDVTGGGPHVNGLYINSGRALETADAGQNTALLEYHFAKYYELPPAGKIRLSGGAMLDYVGQAMSPEYFMVTTEEGGMMAEAGFAVIFAPLETAQALTNHQGMANDLVVTLNSGADRDTIRGEIERTLAGAFPQVTVTYMVPTEDDAYIALYGDIDGDQAMFMLIAYLFLIGAAFGAFSLASRMVEAQRREIGVGMALGVPNARIAIRPLLVAIQIAVLGVIFGIGIGLLLNDLWGKMLLDLLPMPVFETPFQLSLFVQAAILGFVLPFVATLYPVWRAVRVAPVDAIKTGYLVAKGGGLAPAIARIPLPGKSFTQMPIRNVLRSPRRSILTLLGIAVAITLLITMQGMLDSMLITINQGKAEFLKNTPQRMTVNLDFFYPVQWTSVEAIRTSPTVAAAEPGIQVGGYLAHNGVKFETFLGLINLDSSMWKPTITAGGLHSDGPGVILAEKAARDLGVKPGDRITLTHPRREGLFAFRLVDTEVEVVGTHALPLRFMTYMDINQATLMGLQGLTNVVQVIPAAGASQSDVQRALFNQAGIASVQPVSSVVEAFEDLMDMLISFFSITAAAVMALAFLIAFNSTSISVDERAREIATMFAFGVRVRTVTRMTMLENLIMGVLGTLLGIGLGYVVLVWLLTNRMGTMMADISVTIALTPTTLVLAMILGVVVVALTPLFNMRKMLRMDIPSTLRVME